MDLHIQIKQNQTLSPQLVQSMDILQMGTQELLEHIQEAQLENPTLEEEEVPSPTELPQIAPLPTTGDWDSQNSWYDQQDSQDAWTRPSFDRPDRPLGAESLGEYLWNQLDLTPTANPLGAAVAAVIDGLNSWGYLDESLDDLAQRTALPPALLERGLALVQSLDPPGVGARDLPHCLALQLVRQGACGLPLTLVKHHLDHMAQHHFHRIAQETGASREEIQTACNLIRSLNPKPGAPFGDWGTVGYTIPDVLILEGPDGLFVQMNDGNLPALHISPYYRQLLTDSGDAGVQDYLSQKMRQANWLIQGISQRRRTLTLCGDAILRCQMDFFSQGGPLRPLLLRDLAQELSIHESTVSRALRDKYLQCSRGVFPLSHFFSRSVGAETGEGDTTHHQIKARILALITAENKQKPLSDQKLCDLLASEGLAISRRTVAKYLEAMGLPSAPGRRVF